MKRSDYIKDGHLEYLDTLRESEVINMFEAIPYLLASFPSLSGIEAATVLSYWMKMCKRGFK